jgi:hypothetical protein
MVKERLIFFPSIQPVLKLFNPMSGYNIGVLDSSVKPTKLSHGHIPSAGFLTASQEKK